MKEHTEERFVGGLNQDLAVSVEGHPVVPLYFCRRSETLVFVCDLVVSTSYREKNGAPWL